RVPDRLRIARDAPPGRDRARDAPRTPLPAGCERRAPVPRRRRALPRRPALEGARALPRVLPRRDRPRRRSVAPDGMDGARGDRARRARQHAHGCAGSASCRRALGSESPLAVALAQEEAELAQEALGLGGDALGVGLESEAFHVALRALAEQLAAL